MTPKIIFRYSWIYDKHYREHSKGSYPSVRRILKYIKEIERKLREVKNKVLKEIMKLTKIKWKEKEIICYIIGKGVAFSDPLTIRIYKDKNYFIDTLIHELIHRNFMQDMDKTEKLMKPINKKYKKENWNVRIHVLLDQIHKKIYDKFGWRKRMEKEIKYISKLKDYKRAWELVLK